MRQLIEDSTAWRATTPPTLFGPLHHREHLHNVITRRNVKILKNFSNYKLFQPYQNEENKTKEAKVKERTKGHKQSFYAIKVFGV